MPSLSVWLAALLTLSILTFLYKDNPVFRLAENLFAGISLGYYIGIVLNQTLKPNLYLPLRNSITAAVSEGRIPIHDMDLLIAGAIGILLYFRYIPKVAWLSRFALAVYVGYYIGITMLQKLQGEVLPQMKSAVKPIGGLDPASFFNLIFFVGVLTVLLYFFFSKKHEGLYGKVANAGVWFLMISFGAAFGYTVMGRVSLLIGRVDFLWNDWLMPLFR
jgi:hypothetical protein